MKWKKTTATIYLDARDIAIMNQCGHGVTELINKKAEKDYLPPLWSVLSYEMLRNTTNSVNHFWRDYRHSRALAEERDQHYSPAYLQKNTSGTRTLISINIERTLLEHKVSLCFSPTCTGSKVKSLLCLASIPIMMSLEMRETDFWN